MSIHLQSNLAQSHDALQPPILPHYSTHNPAEAAHHETRAHTHTCPRTHTHTNTDTDTHTHTVYPLICSTILECSLPTLSTINVVCIMYIPCYVCMYCVHLPHVC